jgi:hypothetical protein
MAGVGVGAGVGGGEQLEHSVAKIMRPGEQDDPGWFLQYNAPVVTRVGGRF